MGYSVDTSYSDAFVVSPTNATTFTPPLRALYVSSGPTSSTIALVTEKAMEAYNFAVGAGQPIGATGATLATLTWTGATTGSTIPLNIAQVISATGATGLIGLR